MSVVLACVQLCMRMGVALLFYRCVMLARVELLHVSVRMALFFYRGVMLARVKLLHASVRMALPLQRCM